MIMVTITCIAQIRNLGTVTVAILKSGPNTKNTTRNGLSNPNTTARPP